MRKRRLVAAVVIFLLCCAGAALAAPVREEMASESFLFGVLVMFGAQILLVLVVSARMERWVDKRVDARMLDDESVFGRHRGDPYAHEPMRRALGSEFDELVAEVRKAMAAMDQSHREEMRNIMELVRPLLEQNRFAMEVMTAQMRRGPDRPER